MRRQKTVLIVGAGASQKFGLPLGKELKEGIARDLNIMFDDFGSRLQSGSYEIVETLRSLIRDQGGSDINPHRAAAVSISRAMRLSGSIDEFVERHSDDSRVADCAKIAIAKSILEAERASSLHFEHKEYFEDLIGEASDSWLASLLRDITRRKTRSEICSAFKNLYVINFNYDRCFEHFSYLWLQQVYGFSETEAAEVVQSIRIFHPFGKIGELPFQNASTNIRFGAKVSPMRLRAASSAIRTYSETSEMDPELEIAKAELGSAKKVVFLGFAFHEQNMELLTLPERFQRSTLRCYATTYEVSAPRLELDKQTVAEAFQVQTVGGLFFEGANMTCEDFWSEYGDIIVQ